MVVQLFFSSGLIKWSEILKRSRLSKRLILRYIWAANFEVFKLVTIKLSRQSPRLTRDEFYKFIELMDIYSPLPIFQVCPIYFRTLYFHLSLIADQYLNKNTATLPDTNKLLSLICTVCSWQPNSPRGHGWCNELRVGLHTRVRIPRHPKGIRRKDKNWRQAL